MAGARWDERFQAWVLSSYGDVADAFRHPALSADRVTPAAAREGALGDPALDMLSHWMVFTDPPDHTRLRRLVQKAFTPRAVDRMRAGIRATVDRLLDDMADAGGGDLVAGLAHPLPAMVVAELLGASPDDRPRFKQWSDDLATLVFGAMSRAAGNERAHAGVAEFARYFRARAAAVSSADDDLLAGLVAARDRAGSLTEDEIVATATLLLFAGHETTAGLIANGVWLLDAYPDQRDRLASDATLLPTAVEEMLRCEGPAHLMVRVAAHDVELGGTTVREGQRVFLDIHTANHDPDRFPEPDRFDVGRTPNPHLAFGAGIHHCLGAPLARLETEIAVETLLTRFPALRVTGEATWGRGLLGSAVARLPVTLQG